MVFEDQSSTFFRSDSSLNSSGVDNDEETVTFYTRLKEYNSYWAPLFAHIFFFLCCFRLTLLYDQPKFLPNNIFLNLPFLFLAIILLLFPLLFTTQRKIETRTWNPRLWRPKQLKKVLCSCCIDPEDESLLGESHANVLHGYEDDNDYSIHPNRPHEKAYKYLLFNDSSNVDEDLFTNPPPTIVFVHIWLAFIFTMLWYWLSFDSKIDIKVWTIPTYTLLGLAVFFFWKRAVLFGIFSAMAIISTSFLHSTVANHHQFSLFGITAPLYFFPAVLFIASIAVFVYTNSRIMGIFSLIISTLFALWFVGSICFIYNFLHPDNIIPFVRFPASLTLVPLGLVLLCSCLALHIRLAN